MNSDSSMAAALRLLDQIAIELDEELLQREIDDPVDSAAERFLRIETPIDTAPRLNRLLSLLLRRINVRGARPPRKVSCPDALAEAIQILDQSYFSEEASGYDAALLDALETGDAVSAVRCIAEAIKTERREARRRWVMARRVEPLAWPAKCALAEALAHVNAEVLPESLRGLRTAQLASHLPSLLEASLEAEQCIAGPLGHAFPDCFA